MKRSILILLMSHIFFTFCESQLSLRSQIDKLYGTLEEEEKPGVSIAVIEKGKILFSEGFGLANIEHHIPFTPSTISDLGSISKQLTAFAIIMLDEQDKLDLDEDIRTYLTDLPPLGNIVTVRHLIHHTSGIPDIYSLHSLKGMRPGDHVSQDDALMFIKRRPTVDFVPGSRYRYSNTAYMFLAEIIKKVTGFEFEIWMRNNIFIPLQMNNTWIMNIQGEIFPGMADGYKQMEDSYLKIYDNSTLQGGGGVYSTSEDMLKWIDNFRTKKLGSEKVFSIFLDRAILNDGTKLNYAGGINVDKYRGINRNTHNGSSAGYRTKMAYYPDYEMGFIIKSNTPSIGYSHFNIIEDIIIESVIGPDVLPKPNDEKKQISITDFNYVYDTYAGKYYSHELDFTLHVSVIKGTLILNNFFYDFPRLNPAGKDLFKNNGNEVKFLRNEEGEIESILVTTPRASNISFAK